VPKVNGKVILPVGLISVLGISIFSWGSMKSQVNANAKAITKVEKAPIEIAELKKDVEYLKMGQAEMKVMLKEILKNGRR